MWEKLFRNNWALASLSGACIFLSFERFRILPFLILFPIFFNALVARCPTFWSAFRWGFFSSFVMMLGGFYWIVYVIHEFGFLPWWISAILFLGFCGFAALNFPLYAAITSVLHRKIDLSKQPIWWLVVWFSVALPALFTAIEFLIPKLFPWYIGHALFNCLWINQIVELTGVSYLSFMLFSLGSTLGMLLHPPREKTRPYWALGIPAALIVIPLAFSAYRLNEVAPPTRPINLALIQANIGSLQKFESTRGIGKRVRAVVDSYKALTTEAINAVPKPDLILWPETAMPFHIERNGEYPNEIRAAVVDWKTPLITGAYAPSPSQIMVDYNAAYLLDPRPDGTLHIEHYKKNILLAFGEYMPLGDIFPKLYEWFPAVSNFGRGGAQGALTLLDGTKIGVTVCYEMIVPEFFRRVVQPGVNFVVNLTNDSWFGPTAEPYLHASLAVFRAIESRIPFARVTNTGISFATDAYGRQSARTGVYVEGVLPVTLDVPVEPRETFYIHYGDWFIVLCAIALLFSLIPIVGQKRASIPV